MTQVLVFIVVLPLLVGAYLYSLAKQKRFNKQLSPFPKPCEPSLLWGHAPLIGETMGKYQEGQHFDFLMTQILKKAGNPSVILLDMRPFGYPMAIITSHEVAEQISKPSKSYPWSAAKSPTISEFNHLIGPTSMITKNGEAWKEVRKRFNPGFSPQHLMSLLPCILDKTSIFVDRLEEWAKTDQEFKLTKALIDLTFDIIGAVVMDVNFEAQHASTSTRTGQFIRLYETLVSTFGRRTAGRPWWFFPRLVVKRYFIGRKIDASLRELIREKFEKSKDSDSISRSVLNLALRGHNKLTEPLLVETMDSIKTFLFAGHDTTSIVLSWAFYYLSQYPACQKTLFGELDSLFGKDTSPEAIKQQLLSPGGQELLSKMPYTTAVIKETLRLRPPAGTARMPVPGSNFLVHTPEGQDLCLDGMVVYLCATIIQRDKKVYGETADEFVPERWLNDKSGIMSESSSNEDITGRKYPPSAWRPFERGPRNCIGQDLATIEARVILAVVARRFELIKVGLGELERDEKGRYVWENEEEGRKYKIKAEELYNTTQITAKPMDMMRMKVKIRP
ncbi:putative cytochrome P450 E-class, group I [Podospora fimiseda]|uniref:Cytochrome P450 E-class, group I n=1 Tax=Podospora fimiseda TaxID=252190 RepID=A0AAN7BN37_9PEZI|nr:putative cytochrome P450 E-class, group I [Podospora fimiseda]